MRGLGLIFLKIRLQQERFIFKMNLFYLVSVKSIGFVVMNLYATVSVYMCWVSFCFKK